MNGELIEKMITYERNGQVEKDYTRTTFEYDALENRKTLIEYNSIGSPSNWEFQYQRDSIYDVNGCLVKTTLISQNPNSNNSSIRWIITTPDSNCSPQVIEIWEPDQFQNMHPTSQIQYEYLDNGKQIFQTGKDWSSSLNDWEVDYIIEREFDNEGRELRLFTKNYKSNVVDTLIQITTYTSKGEIETFKKYFSRHAFNNIPLRLVRSDSLIYEYDEHDNLIRKDLYYRGYDNPVDLVSTTYSYYCNGQLKTETVFRDDKPVFQMLYEYHEGVDCPLEEGEHPIRLYPNPIIDDRLVIHSNLLMAKDAQIQVFTLLGQELLSTSVEEETYRYALNIPSGWKGQYVVMVSNSKERVGEIFIVPQ